MRGEARVTFESLQTGTWLAALSVAVVLFVPSSALAEGRLGLPRATQAGTFGGIAYIQYDGIFEGETTGDYPFGGYAPGSYRVPYRITAPANRRRGNHTVVVEPPGEPPHLAEDNPVAELNPLLLPGEMVPPEGSAHAGVGWSTTSHGEGSNLRILDPTVPGVFVQGGFPDEGGRTDDKIVVDFANALEEDPVARRILGHVERRYLTGFSDSAGPLFRLLSSGQATGVFDLILAFTATPKAADTQDPQEALETGRFDGKVIIVNSEEGVEDSGILVDRGGVPDHYRFYQVAGSPNLPDPLVPFRSNMTTPASFLPELRAHFLQGDRWVNHGQRPPPSTHLETSDGGTLDRDANGNAMSVDTQGRRAPRLPMLELGEAHYLVGNSLGSFENVKTIETLGFSSHKAYLVAFAHKLKDYLHAGYILPHDADAMLRRAALCPPLTYTETYRDHYDRFVAIIPCGD